MRTHTHTLNTQHALALIIMSRQTGKPQIMIRHGAAPKVKDTLQVQPYGKMYLQQNGHNQLVGRVTAPDVDRLYGEADDVMTMTFAVC